jgi:hypothetical protein
VVFSTRLFVTTGCPYRNAFETFGVPVLGSFG